MKKISCILFLIVLLLSQPELGLSSPIAKTWIYATVLIENELGEKGTGFLVIRETEKGKGRIFLCTNKHVLNKTEELRNKASLIICWLNVKTKTDEIVGKPFILALKASDGSKRWREHPEENIDVMAFDVTDLISQNPEIEKKWAEYSLFANKEILSSQDITIGEDVLIVGYPLGKKQGKTNFPLVLQGIIASQIGKEFAEDYNDKYGNPVQKTYRGFLIDGGAIPGSSGSPVILKPISGRVVDGNIIENPPRPYLLGILSETRFAFFETEDRIIPSYAGLGLVFDSSTIIETIELFFE